MRQARFVRGGVLALLAGAIGAGSAGCTHNYYYGNVPPCGPGVIEPGTLQNGSVCEVPTQVVGGTVVASGPTGTTTTALGGPRPPRIVVSEPMNGSSRFPWRRSDPESGIATTNVEGALGDSTATR